MHYRSLLIIGAGIITAYRDRW